METRGSWLTFFFPTWAHSIHPLKVLKKRLLKKKKEIQSYSDVLLTETAGVLTILIRAEFYCIQTSGSIKGRESLNKPEHQMNRLIKYHYGGSLKQADLQPFPSGPGSGSREEMPVYLRGSGRVSFSWIPAAFFFFLNFHICSLLLEH